jgi:polyisoprenoid-binding protein YceI
MAVTRARTARLRFLKPCIVSGVVLCALACSLTLQAQDATLELDPAASKIQFTLDATLHTVHGSFALKSGSVHFNPSTGTISGIIIANATSAETGNSGRDRKMHKDVLESAKYPEISFTPTRILRPFSWSEAEPKVQVEGVLRLHGSDHNVTLSFPLHVEGKTLHTHTEFTVPYVDWGLKNPSNLFLHVSDMVSVEVEISGQILSNVAALR